MIHGAVIWHSSELGICGRAYGGGILRAGEVFVQTRPTPLPFSLVGAMRVLRARMGIVVWTMKQWLFAGGGKAE